MAWNANGRFAAPQLLLPLTLHSTPHLPSIIRKEVPLKAMACDAETECSIVLRQLLDQHRDKIELARQLALQGPAVLWGGGAGGGARAQGGTGNNNRQFLDQRASAPPPSPPPGTYWGHGGGSSGAAGGLGRRLSSEDVPLPFPPHLMPPHLRKSNSFNRNTPSPQGAFGGRAGGGVEDDYGRAWEAGPTPPDHDNDAYCPPAVKLEVDAHPAGSMGAGAGNQAGGPGADLAALSLQPHARPAAGVLPPGTLPPGTLPPGSLPLGMLPPGTLPSQPFKAPPAPPKAATAPQQPHQPGFGPAAAAGAMGASMGWAHGGQLQGQGMGISAGSGLAPGGGGNPWMQQQQQQQYLQDPQLTQLLGFKVGSSLVLNPPLVLPAQQQPQQQVVFLQQPQLQQQPQVLVLMPPQAQPMHGIVGSAGPPGVPAAGSAAHVGGMPQGASGAPTPAPVGARAGDVTAAGTALGAAANEPGMAGVVGAVVATGDQDAKLEALKHELEHEMQELEQELKQEEEQQQLHCFVFSMPRPEDFAAPSYVPVAMRDDEVGDAGGGQEDTAAAAAAARGEVFQDLDDAELYGDDDEDDGGDGV